MSLFITCPVASVERATAFYAALGWTRDEGMSGPRNACFAIAPEQYVMIGSREMYASVGGVEELIGDTDEYPFMYQRQFDDLDGYHYSPFWMVPGADPVG